MKKNIIGSLSKEVFVQFALFFACLREFTFFGFRGVLCPSEWLRITGPCEYTTVTHEMVLLLLLMALMVLQLFRERAWRGYAEACKAHWLVFIFVGFAGISIFWSLEIVITLYKFIVLLCCTLIAIYIGFSYNLKEILKRVSWYFGLICGLSLIYVIFSPEGIMSDPYYQGAWTGIFTHRNHFGCFMALGVVLFLVNLLSMKKPFKGYFYYNLLMLGVTCLLVFMSKSATAMITTLVLTLSIIILFTWLKWGQKLRPVHYFWIGGVFLSIFVLVLFNINHLLSIFGRNISLTGRVPMWQFLYRNVIKQRLWLGYGYGAIWHLEGFIIELTKSVEWIIPVALGDSGYIDILLHLGVVGLILLVTMIVTGFIRGVRLFIKERTILNAFPILALVYVVVANISMSLILESETFVWSIVMASLVAIRHTTQQKSVQNQGLA